MTRKSYNEPEKDGQYNRVPVQDSSSSFSSEDLTFGPASA